MFDPFDKQRKYLLWSFILIVFLIITGIASAAEKSEWLNKNPCMIKVVITNTEINGVTTTTKEEIRGNIRKLFTGENDHSRKQEVSQDGKTTT